MVGGFEPRMAVNWSAEIYEVVFPHFLVSFLPSGRLSGPWPLSFCDYSIGLDDSGTMRLVGSDGVESMVAMNQSLDQVTDHTLGFKGYL